MAKKTVKPEVLGGFIDILPREAIAQNALFSMISEAYEAFGFVPLDTPSMERVEVLTGGDDDFDKSIFVAKIVRGAEDRGSSYDFGEGESFGLRFDLTVPLARAFSAHSNDLPRPFKRYQIGKVFRGERQQKGRFREFYQCDFDIVGSDSTMADVEVIQVMEGVMTKLGFTEFVIRFNSRNILNGLAEVLGCGERSNEVFRIIDKLDKIGLDGVVTELQRKPDNEWDESALALSEEQADKVKAFLAIKPGDNDRTMSELKDFFKGQAGVCQKGIAELAYMIETLRAIGVDESHWSLDLSVARGLGYYTGPVFETVLTDKPELGSVFSGGRFDGLTNRFIPDSNIPAVGASVGLSRLMVAMKEKGLLPEKDNVTDVLVTVFPSAGQELLSAKTAKAIRDNGFNVELYYGQDNSLRAQFSYAAKRGIPYAVVIGPDEAKEGKLQLKDMNARNQEVLTMAEAIAKLKGSLGK